MLRQESVPAVTFLAEACRSLSDWPSGRTVTCAPYRCSSDPEASGPLLEMFPISPCSGMHCRTA